MIAAIVLAAGRSSRMGANKLLVDLGGRPLVTHTVANALASSASPVVVVTGHMRDDVETALSGPHIVFAANRDYASGMASSLAVGLAAAPAAAEGALILLGDMPLIAPEIMNRLIAASAARPDASAIVPTVDGEWAHPVLLRRVLFPAVMALTGDAGARRVLNSRSDVALIPIDDPRCLMDADDPAALATIRLELEKERRR
ncbi:nucleotidyltransferase family protein [Terrarubrum flagellatum]|uniref:nucleotidyltransferase family protein n=1 Tax=Terrirubrum flagellatum TaxID=2895980 RepID=UPI003144D649